jgi:hypothetical protein
VQSDATSKGTPVAEKSAHAAGSTAGKQAAARLVLAQGEAAMRDELGEGETAGQCRC